MIKGAVLIGIGFGLGYAKAVSDHEEIRVAAVAFRNFLNDIALAEEIKKKEAADRAAGAVREPEEPEEELDEVIEIPETDEESETTP